MTSSGNVFEPCCGSRRIWLRRCSVLRAVFVAGGRRDTYLDDETGVGVRVVRLAHRGLRRPGADPRRARRGASDAAGHLLL